MYLEILEFLCLILVLTLGVLSSFTDINYSKIRNKTLIIFLFASIFLNFLIFIYLVYTGIFKFYFLFFFIINILASLISGYLLYYFNIWSAGDGKLFFIFICLIPLSLYAKSTFLMWPFLVCLINIFILSLFFILINFIYRIFYIKVSFMEIGHIITEDLRTNFFKYLYRLFVITWILSYIFSLLNFYIDPILIQVFTLIIIFLFEKFLSKINVLLIGGVILRFIFDSSIYSLSYILNFIVYLFVFVMIFGVFKKIIDFSSLSIFSYVVSSKELKCGMFMSEKIICKNKLDFKEIASLKKAKIPFRKYKGKWYILYLNNQVIEPSILNSNKIGVEELKILKRIGFKRYRISQILPFAPFIFLGIIVTFLIRKDAISFIKSILSN